MSQRQLGDFIRQTREKRGMTLRALASKVGISAPFLTDLEHGRRSTSKLPEIAKALGVAVEKLQFYEARVDDDLKKWIEENPGLVRLLRETRKLNKKTRRTYR